MNFVSYAVRYVLLGLGIFLVGGCFPIQTEEVEQRSSVDYANVDRPLENSQWSLPFERDLKSGSGESVSDRKYSELFSLCDRTQSACEYFLGITNGGAKGGNRSVFIFHVKTGLGIRLGKLPKKAELISYHSLSGSLIVTQKSRVSRVSLPNLEEVESLERIKTAIRAIDVSATDHLVLIGAADGRLYRWGWEIEDHPSERGQGRFDVERYFAHASVVSAVQFHPSGRVFFSGDWTGAITSWKGFEQDPFSGQYDQNIFGTGYFTEASPRKPLPGGVRSRVESVKVNTFGTYLATAYGSGEVDIWKLRGLSQVVRFSHHRGTISLLAFAPSAKSVVTYGRDQRLVASKIKKTRDPVLSQDVYEAQQLFEQRIPKVFSAHYMNRDSVLLATEGGLKVLKLNDEGAELTELVR